MSYGTTSFMERRRTMLRGIRIVMAAMVSLPMASLAQEIRIANADCSQPVHLVARDARLSSVLKDLSETLHFTIVYQSETDPLVTTDARSFPIELVRTIARDMNFSLEEAADARCAQGRRIARISVLADPAAGNRATVASARPAWQTPEMERIARLGMSDYLRSHGLPDQPIEELAVH